MKTSILVMSCDAYSDLWEPFFILKKKYWKDCPYDVYVGSETKVCKHATTIKAKGLWTTRLRKTLEKIDSDYIVFMLEDYFIREQVDQKQIDFCLDNFDEQTAAFDFQNVLANQFAFFNEKDVKGQFTSRRNKQMYLTNTQPSVWDRKKLLELCQQDVGIWEWETQVLNSPYKYYINRGEHIINIGYYKDRKPWGVVQGKWSKEVIKLFKKENIKMDLDNREYLDIDLSIIIPYYKTKKRTQELMDVLIPQLNNRAEVIMVDDGCDEHSFDKLPIKVIHQSNGGPSKARNVGLDKHRGRYVFFQDSDDLMKPNFIEKWLNKIDDGDFSYGLHSWEYQNGRPVIITDQPPKDNNCLWNCVYNSVSIGDTRFDETLQISEEISFNEKVRKGVKVNIEDVLYTYNSGEEGSLSSLFRAGKISAIRPIKTQVVIYRSKVTPIGGIETAVYNTCEALKDIYDIVFVYDIDEGDQVKRLSKLVKCVKYTGIPIECDFFLYYGLNPQAIEKNTKSPIFHQQICNNMDAVMHHYPKSPKTTSTTADSKTSAIVLMKYAPDVKCGVLHNIFTRGPEKKCFHLMSATRIAPDKGSIGARMKMFADRLNERKIPFTWEIFTNDVFNVEIEGVVLRKPRLNVVDYIWGKDYGVQFSTHESWGGTTTEFLERGVPMLCTRYESVDEQIIDGQNGFILELDMSNMDKVIDKMLEKDLKGFKYDKKDSIKEFTDLIGDLGGKKDTYEYRYVKDTIKVKVMQNYTDIELNKYLIKGTIIDMKEDRAEQLNRLGFIKIIGR